MAAVKTKAVEKDVDALISLVTGFSQEVEEDQENFELCQHYVLSNIYYHRYLDTNSHDVRRQLEGLATKFRVHAMPARASRLERLWRRLVDCEEWRESSQWDIEWRLLSLLINLSNNPTSLEASGPRPEDGADPAVSRAPPPEPEVDWARELRLPEDDWSPYQSPEEWSDLDDDDDADRTPLLGRHGSVGSPTSGAGAGTGPAARAPPPSGPEEDPRDWLEEHVTSWYQPRESGPGPLRPAPDAAEAYHSYLVRLGLAGAQDVTKVSELSVCREVVWQFLRPTESPLFELRDGQFVPTSRFRVQGLTTAAFSSQLRRLCAPIGALDRLRRFARDAAGAGAVSTYRAFAAGLARHLSGLDAELVTLESQLLREEVTLTLLGLQARLSEWTSHLAELDRLLHQGVLCLRPETPGWARAARLVSVLCEAVQVCCDQRWSSPLVQLLLDSVQPLVSIVDGWTVSETDPDPSREFLIERNEKISVTDAEYWNSGFTVHSRFEEWWTDGVEPVPFLLPHLDQIVQIAKCLRILCHLKMTSYIDDSSLQDEFNRLVREALSGVESAPSRAVQNEPDPDPDPEPESESKSESESESESDDVGETQSVDSGRGSEPAALPPPPPPAPPSLLQQLLDSCGSPYLTAAFQDVLETLTGADHLSAEPARLAPETRLTSSVSRAVSAALGPPVAARLDSVCRRLVAALRSDYRLGEHLRMLRRVFLMEAGDLMAGFSQHLFRTLEFEPASDESVRLTLCLEDVVSARYPELAARFSVSAGRPEPSRPLLERLGAVTLQYAAPWPCTIVITADSLRRYNDMFRVILQLKFTLRQLQALSFKDLSEADAEDRESSAGLGLDGSGCAPPATRSLRLQLLRAWLLHFVGSLHSYIMMRVLHSTCLELEAQLDKALDVDSMVRVHSQYVAVLHRRCLLAGAAERHLHAAVLAGLRTALAVCAAWRAAARLSEAELGRLEAEYVRCHRLVTGLLLQYRRSMSHVDSLAAAMAHSAPCQVAHGELG